MNYELTEIQKERFFKKIKRSETGCWEWVGAKNDAGYGMFYTLRLDGRYKGNRAHRLSWILANNRPIDEGKHVCHSCDNPPCVNPSHLWLGTNEENRADSILKGRSAPPPTKKHYTHCKWGHEFTIENSYFHRRGRACKTCTLRRSKERKLKLKQERLKCKSE